MQNLVNVQMPKSMIQRLIKANAEEINILTYLKEEMQRNVSEVYWPKCIPDGGCDSELQFELLNKSKDALRGILKELEHLTAMQRFLKSSLKGVK